MEFHLTEGGIRTKLEYGELAIAGNDDHGYRPFQLMIASIAGCSASVFRKVLAKKKINIDDLKIRTETVRDMHDANRILEIKLHFVVKGTRLNIETLEKSLEIAHRNCPMVRSVENSIQVKETLELINLVD
ncbi:putative OsmC-like protein [Gracilibacillus halotolerans]|uniref:Putative OsmC-like protein n=1 Tax=Gracilibacillus halotolerans TaxID=74386 RepID=A0A841RQQ1_9BACI|nr:OsmC family protein [Gracilibacillus halotolerans]MBB6513535.1 putative OsmC-like protein [Gracilibacillus halotolerans]